MKETLPSLVLERLDDRLRLYLGGDLQFDTADEAIYHERLAHPALGVARSRFAGPLDLLVLGGGDGLLVRELRKAGDVRSIRVVDLDARVVALARSELALYNGGSLDDPRVRVTVADARDAIGDDARFHAIFCDLTFPSGVDDCGLFARDWFARWKGRLHPGGVLALNSVSPDKTPRAFWSVYQTLRAAGLEALPGHFALPSFAELGYGRWGFALASDRRIEAAEIEGGDWPAALTSLTRANVRDCFRFPGSWAAARSAARPVVDQGRILFEALVDSVEVAADDSPVVDFLGLADPGPIPDAAEPGSLRHPRFRDWLARRPGSGVDDLLAAVPPSHRIITRDLLRDWSGHLFEILKGVDLRRLISALLKRATALPARLVEELRRFRRALARGLNPAQDLTTWGWRFFSVLMLVLVLSQTAFPTAAYAKGGGGVSSGGSHSFAAAPRGGGGGFRPIFFGGGRHYGHGSSHGGSSSAGAGEEGDDEAVRRVFGGLLLAGGLGVAAYSARKKPS